MEFAWWNGGNCVCARQTPQAQARVVDGPGHPGALLATGPGGRTHSRAGIRVVGGRSGKSQESWKNWRRFWGSRRSFIWPGRDLRRRSLQAPVRGSLREPLGSESGPHGPTGGFPLESFIFVGRPRRGSPPRSATPLGALGHASDTSRRPLGPSRADGASAQPMDGVGAAGIVQTDREIFRPDRLAAGAARARLTSEQLRLLWSLQGGPRCCEPPRAVSLVVVSLPRAGDGQGSPAPFLPRAKVRIG